MAKNRLEPLGKPGIGASHILSRNYFPHCGPTAVGAVGSAYSLVHLYVTAALSIVYTNTIAAV